MRHWGRYRHGIVLALLGLTAGAVAGTGDTPARWSPAWTAAMQRPFPDEPERFQDETVRLVVRPSIGGRRLRVIMSNLFGTMPLTIGAAHAARIATGATIDPASDRAVTFGGAGAVTIAPGAIAVSDPVALPVASGAPVAVSLYFPGPAEVTTTHTLALRTGRVVRGNQVGIAALTGGREIADRPFLAALEVEAPGALAAYVVGDSGVDGDGSSDNADHRWTDYLAAKYSAGIGGKPLAILNLGLIGNRLLRDSPGVPPYFDGLGQAGLRRFDREVPGRAGGCVVLRIGINDIGFGGLYPNEGGPVGVAELSRGYRAFVDAAHRRGLRVLGTTLTPFEGATNIKGYYAPDKERVRRRLNDWMRRTHPFDGLIDLDLALRDTGHPSRLAARYDSGDHLHVNDIGYAAAAAASNLSACFTRSRR